MEFGFPGPEMCEASDRGQIVLGGCLIDNDDLVWECVQCGTRITEPRRRSRS